MNAIQWMQESRKWIITVIVLIIVLGLSYIGYRLVNTKLVEYDAKVQSRDQSINNWKNLAGEKDSELSKKEQAIKDKDELIKKLMNKPKVSIDYVCEGGTMQRRDNKVVCVHTDGTETNSISADSLFNEYCFECDKNKLTPNLTFDTEGFTCVANMCTKKGNCKAKPKGENDIVDTITDKNKATIWTHPTMIGYDAMNNAFELAYSPLDYKGFLIGPDIFTDFKTAENSGVGLQVFYRPNIDFKNSVYKTNVAFGGGVSTHFDDFQRIGAQVSINAIVAERTKK